MRLSGVLLILLGLAHAGFDRRLKWKTDIRKLTPINRQIFVVHWAYIAFFLVLAGLLCLIVTRPLLQPGPLSRAILFGTTAIWATRLLVQWLVFDRNLWQHDRSDRAVHYLLSAVWIYLLAVNSVALCRVAF